LGAGPLDAGGVNRLQIVLGKYVEAGVIALLLLFNAALSSSRRAGTGDAGSTEISAGADRVGAAGRGVEEPARSGLVPGDIVKLSLGAWSPRTFG